MMTIIHLLMFGFLVGAGLSAVHFSLRRWAEARDIACPVGKLVHAVRGVTELGALGLGAYVLATVGWAAVPAAATGFLITRPAVSRANASHR